MSIIAPSFLCLITFHRATKGLNAKWWGVSAGVLFVVLVLSTIVIHIVQWVYAKRVVKHASVLHLPSISRMPIGRVGVNAFGPFRIEQDDRFVIAKRPWRRAWRIHRLLVVLLGIVAFAGYMMYLFPSVSLHRSIYDFAKIVFSAFMCLATVWYARKQKFLAWTYDRETNLLSVQQLVGVIRSEVVSIQFDNVSGVQFSPTGLFTGQTQAYIIRETESGESESIPVPIDPLSMETKTARDAANNWMGVIRLMLFLHIIGQQVDAFDHRAVSLGVDHPIA